MWVLIAVAVIGAIQLVARRARQRPAAKPMSLDERQARVLSTVSGWTRRGWSLERENADSAVVSREGEQVLIRVDLRGHVTSSRMHD
jgi:hypothetical protein